MAKDFALHLCAFGVEEIQTGIWMCLSAGKPVVILVAPLSGAISGVLQNRDERIVTIGV